MNVTFPRVLTLGLLACLPWTHGVASPGSESYVEGIHIRWVGRMDVFKEFRKLEQHCPDPGYEKASQYEVDGYYAVIGGDLWIAKYKRSFGLVVRGATAAEAWEGLISGKPPCLALRVERRERVSILGPTKHYWRDENGKWTVTPAPSPESALFFAQVLEERGNFKRLGKSSVANVECTLYASGKTGESTICIAEEEVLRQHGIRSVKRLVLQVKENPLTEFTATHIDFKAKIPYSVLMPPSEIMNRPVQGVKEVVVTPTERRARASSAAKASER